METIWHAMKSMEKYGESAIEVHIWLDKYWNGEPDDHEHRKILHNEKGVEMGVKKFGEYARKHLELHIEDDKKSNSPRNI